MYDIYVLRAAVNVTVGVYYRARLQSGCQR